MVLKMRALPRQIAAEYNRGMVRLLLVFALLWPVAAGASSKKKKRSHDEVEIWPPPAPGTDQAGEVLPPPKPKPPPPSDAGDPYTPDPSVTDDSLPPTTTTSSNDEDDEDACADAYSSCSEDCTVAHSNDDTLHVKPGTKLPIQVCEGRCKHRFNICKEQKRIGIDQNDPNRAEDEDRE